MDLAREDITASLADDPACEGLLQPGAALLVWDRSGERLLWASDAAKARGASGPARKMEPLRPAPPAPERLRALVNGLAPRRGVRLERLRLDTDRLAPLVTCACRLLTLPSGEEVLLTAPVGPVHRPGLRRRPGHGPEPSEGSGRHRVGEAAFPRQAGEDARPAEPSAVQDAPARPHAGTIRFTWQADAATRFTAVSPALAEIVGPEGAAVIGRTWAEVLRDRVADPSGVVAALFAEGATWSGRTVYWRIGDGDDAVAVDLAGMPALGLERQALGFRGFGLCRAGIVVRWSRVNAAAPTAGFSPLRAGEGAPDDPKLSQAAAPASREQDDAGAVGLPPSSEDSAFDGAVNRPQPSAPPAAAERPASDQGSHTANADRRNTPPGPIGGPVATGLGQGRAVPLRPVEDRPPDRLDSKPRLSVAERSAFREIARALGVRYAGDDPLELAEEPKPAVEVVPARVSQEPPLDPVRVLDRLPTGVLVHRGEQVLFANRLLLDWTGYESVEALTVDGGVARLFRGQAQDAARPAGAPLLALSTRLDGAIAVEARLTTIDWGGTPAGLMVIRKVPADDATQRLRAMELELRDREARVREMSAILDTATDGVLVLDESGRILSLNRSAEALFGYDQKEVTGEPVTVLLAPESHAVALEYLASLQADGMASLLNDGREALGRVRQGGAIPLFMTMGRVSEGPERKFCAVLRDITAAKKAEGALQAAQRAAEAASVQRLDLFAKLNHEVRTPLNAIIGFAEVMLGERFGPIGNERYKEYVQDVHAAGRRVVKLVDDLLELARVEAGQADLTFTGVNLNALVADCVAQMQPQAARERIVMRTSFAIQQPSIVADERSLRRIVLNIVSNAIRFTDAGGQIIISTAVMDRGEVALRVRDTGVGMTGAEIEAALQPFGHLTTARRGDGAGLGLPLTQALVTANRGALQITSAPNEGTLVEVLFPPTRVLAR